MHPGIHPLKHKNYHDNIKQTGDDGATAGRCKVSISYMHGAMLTHAYICGFMHV